MLREICPKCDGEGFISYPAPASVRASLRAVCPLCHGRRWISPWRKVEEELPPPQDKVSEVVSVWVNLCNWSPELKKELFHWERAYYVFANREWYDADDRVTFGNYWQPIEPPEREDL
jgi:hypothetical protein